MRGGIEPSAIVKGVSDIAEFLQSDQSKLPNKRGKGRRSAADRDTRDVAELQTMIVELEEEMLQAAEELRFEHAAHLRDDLREARREFEMAKAAGAAV